MKRKEITDVMKNVTLTYVIMMEVTVDLDSIPGSFVMQQHVEEKLIFKEKINKSLYNFYDIGLQRYRD